MSAHLTAAQAIERANLWTVKAQPIGRALLALAATERDLLESCDQQLWDTVRAAIADHEYRLRRILEDLRDDAICNALPNHPCTINATQDQWDAYDELCDLVNRDTITVAGLIRQMEEEA